MLKETREKENHNKKILKDSEKEEKSNLSLSKDTLERILETKPQRKTIKVIDESESIISDEELKMLSQHKKKKKDDSEEQTIVRKPIFLERELSDESASINSKRNEFGSQDSEYISKNKQEEKSGAKYQHYETTSSMKFQKAGEISKSWSKPFQTREAGFISSESGRMPKQESNYQIYTNPQRTEDLQKEKKEKGIMFTEAKKEYYSHDH
jgi:hypothetical protein